MTVDRLVTVMNEPHTWVLLELSHMEEAGEQGPASPSCHKSMFTSGLFYEFWFRENVFGEEDHMPA